MKSNGARAMRRYYNWLCELIWPGGRNATENELRRKLTAASKATTTAIKNLAARERLAKKEAEELGLRIADAVAASGRWKEECEHLKQEHDKQAAAIELHELEIKGLAGLAAKYKQLLSDEFAIAYPEKAKGKPNEQNISGRRD